MFIVIGIVTVAYNVDLPQGWSLTWWLTRPLWFGACLFILLALVNVFEPIELRRGPIAQSVDRHKNPPNGTKLVPINAPLNGPA